MCRDGWPAFDRRPPRGEPRTAGTPPPTTPHPPQRRTASTRTQAHSEHPDPPERTDGRRLVRDPDDAACITLLPKSPEHHASGREPEPVDREPLTDLTAALTGGHLLNTPAGGLIAPGQSLVTVHDPYPRATVRHPYDMWTPRFTQHRRRHPRTETLTLRIPLGSTVEPSHPRQPRNDAPLRPAAHRPTPRALLPGTPRPQGPRRGRGGHRHRATPTPRRPRRWGEDEWDRRVGTRRVRSRDGQPRGRPGGRQPRPRAERAGSCQVVRDTVPPGSSRSLLQVRQQRPGPVRVRLPGAADLAGAGLTGAGLTGAGPA
ncbi:hypothetical protein OG689_39860 [Kitasatospora sp. NBC_00240]|uniref:hypothetical protein n=1 Tax=Kitasatospora sp. NBC_00240 TaxID=2903567 RepID=UPI002253F368|nr:hypothetical protein [Kitasatospora sp. NBC_00240]MCX5215335.1 hypothetical protein [Kitasatospora sp. NBC_00240]